MVACLICFLKFCSIFIQEVEVVVLIHLHQPTCFVVLAPLLLFIHYYLLAGSVYFLIIHYSAFPNFLSIFDLCISYLFTKVLFLTFFFQTDVSELSNSNSGSSSRSSSSSSSGSC